MRVKTNVAELIARLEAKKRRLREEHQAAVEAHPAAVEEYRRLVVKALERELARVKHGGNLPAESHSYRGGRSLYGVLVPVKGRRPARPGRVDTHRLDARLKELRLSSQQDITIDPHHADWRGVL